MNSIEHQLDRRQFLVAAAASAGALALASCTNQTHEQTPPTKETGVYRLPNLDWDYSALEPHISGEINQLHHDKHHAAYVKGANDALEQLAQAREKGDNATIVQLEKNLAFNLGGHANHSIWWQNLSPHGGDKPEGELGGAIDEHFGGFDKFRDQFSAAANGVQGSGWAWLGYDTLGKKLLTFQMYDQQSNVPFGTIPLLGLDVFEHAYYLQYKNVKADYIKAFWNVVNWPDVQARFAAAVSKTPGLIFP
ncbi:superoxide dismutase [Mycobacteroides abscessus]|uniref:superoxide dismutase n=1 Tax=Mycobacteroides abscessus TaxID=36809 RepID=UPI00031399BF|nr:superoxide dismutase [Mycobacteroides abscessus]MBL3750845.1 superoxide dismutase [Mycobacteroides abscessus subsp. massiliense]MDM2642965.1 superoxide dismutase [Mycobacteroides abscessus]MDM2652768.1 superoxide dismutase [Mycobacteroides abscessus]MDM2662325.1 superoxide dismutase [Mycobacteroides abscessus]MDM2667433.1 superoxide dismutase [Mycobacteroides abscessus]